MFGVDLENIRVPVSLMNAGLCFTKDGKTLRQHPMLGGVVIGGAYPEQWGMPQPDADFFDVKGDLEALLQLTGHYKDINFKAEKHPSLHPVRCARIYCAEKPIGYLGELHPKIKQELEGQVNFLKLFI